MLRFKALFFFVTLVCSPQLFAGQSTSCYQHPEFVKPLPSAIAKKWYQRLPKNSIANTERLLAAYAADIRNMGQQDIVFLTMDTTGNAGYQTVYVAQRHGKSLDFIGEMPKPANAGDGPFYFHIYQNAQNQQEFLTHLCGKTYTSFSLANAYRDSFYWQGTTNTSACDSNWSRYERYDFQKKYHHKNYQDAFSQLHFYANTCKAKLNAQDAVFIQADLAKAAFKLSRFKQCRAILDSLTKTPLFKHAHSDFRKTVNKLAHQCQRWANAKTSLLPPQGKNAYAWALQLKNINPLNREFKNLKKKLYFSLIPDVQDANKDFYQAFMTSAEQGINNELYNNTLATSDITISHNRYLMDSASMPHNMSQQAFFWVDAKAGTSIIGVVDTYEPPYHFYITSKNFTPTTFPALAKQFLINTWGKDKHLDKAIIDFYDMSQGKVIRLQASWLKP